MAVAQDNHAEVDPSSTYYVLQSNVGEVESNHVQHVRTVFTICWGECEMCIFTWPPRQTMQNATYPPVSVASFPISALVAIQHS